MVKNGAAKSERDAARKIAAESGEPEATVRIRIKRGKKKLGSGEPTPKPKTVTKAAAWKKVGSGEPIPGFPGIGKVETGCCSS